MLTSTTTIIDAKDLEIKVRDFFRELGYDAETQVPVALANQGSAIVDVVATKSQFSLAHKILFECKFWNSDVPRAIVQSFKMDVLEAGANFGIIVSKQGFQSGAYQGVELTTVKLYTFEELQIAFANEWAIKNIWPLIEQHNTLVDLARVFDIATPERENYESKLFNQELKILHEDLWASTLFPLSVWSDYFDRDAKRIISPPANVRFNTDHPDGTPREAIFHDARTMVKCFKDLFSNAFERWENFNKTYEKAFFKLPIEKQLALFKLPQKPPLISEEGT